MSSGKKPAVCQNIIYGGTFDPPHMGHRDCLLAAHQKFPEAELTVLVSPKPAVAGGSMKMPTLSFSDRLELSSINFSGDGFSKKVAISDFEAGLPAPHFTFQTLLALKAKTGGVSLGWLMGFDQCQKFLNWHEPKKILGAATLILSYRGDEQANVADTIALWQNSLGIEIIASDENDCYELPEFGTRIVFLRTPTCAVSSSVIKTLLHQGKSLPSGWLKPEVAERAQTLLKDPKNDAS